VDHENEECTNDSDYTSSQEACAGWLGILEDSCPVDYKKIDKKTESGITTISVSNARQFLGALGSDRIIEIKPGIYNLSELVPFYYDGSEIQVSYEVYWKYIGDGYELVLDGINNLTIRGAGASGSNTTEIVVEPRYAYVLNFIESSNIVIENLKAGHTEGGYCSGGVFNFYNSSHISITGTYMYGSGAEGLTLTNVFDMNVTNSRIYECTYSIMTVANSRNIFFERCLFRDNQEFDLINVYNTENLSFEDCEFRNNRGLGMFAVQDGEVFVRNSIFSGNITENPIESSSNVSFIGCEFE